MLLKILATFAEFEFEVEVDLCSARARNSLGGPGRDGLRQCLDYLAYIDHLARLPHMQTYTSQLALKSVKRSATLLIHTSTPEAPLTPNQAPCAMPGRSGQLAG